MRIAMMTNNYKPFIGGVPISVERLSDGLRRRGHEVCIFAPEYGEDEEEMWEQDVVRYRSCERRFKNGMVIPNVFDARIPDEFEWWDFDLIHVHQPMLIGNVAMHLKTKYQIPLVYTYHTRYEEYLHYLVEGSLGNRQTVQRCLDQGKKLLPKYMASYMRRCDLVLAPSADMRNYLGEQGLETLVRVLPTGLSEQAYEMNEQRARTIRERYGRGRRYVFCTVSRLDKEKNQYFLLRCIRKLKAKVGDDFLMMIVGDGAERETLIRCACELQISDVVSFIGAVPNGEVKDYLFASDAFLFTSKSETQGIVLAEAMAAGLPVVAVSACGVNDIVNDRVNGYLTEEIEEAFAARVEELIRHPSKIEVFGQEAVRTAQNYRMDHIAAQAEEDYQMVLQEKRRIECYGREKYEKKHVMPSFLRLFKAS